MEGAYNEQRAAIHSCCGVGATRAVLSAAVVFMMMKLLLSGALVSLLNFAIHGIVTGLIVVATRHTATRTEHLSIFFRVTALLIITTAALTCAHVVEISVWAMFYSIAEIEIENVSIFEFAFENYTALGYGDAVVKGGYRLIGPITALNGLLLIGWSVAIIFEVLRMAEVQIKKSEADRVP